MEATATAPETAAAPAVVETPAVTTPADNPWSGLVGDGGSFREGWQETLPEDLRPSASNFKDLPTLVKAFQDNQRAARAKTEGMVRVPCADATPEDIAAFRRAQGIPDAPDGYGLKDVKAPEGIAFDEAKLAAFATKAHELGLHPKAAQELLAWHAQDTALAMQAQQQQYQQAVEADNARLKEVFGSHYEAKMTDFARVSQALGIDPKAVQGGDLTPSDVVIALAKLAPMFAPDKLPSAESVSNALSPGDQARDIQTNPNNPLYAAYRDSAHPNHKMALDQVMSLLQRAG